MRSIPRRSGVIGVSAGRDRVIESATIGHS
jgi:hypothetical protein